MTTHSLLYNRSQLFVNKAERFFSCPPLDHRIQFLETTVMMNNAKLECQCD